MRLLIDTDVALGIEHEGRPRDIDEAVEFLAESLREAPAHLAAIGPLTDIGLLAFYHPELLNRVQSLIMVAGRSEDAPFYIGERGPIQDFNFENDVRAARLVLETEVTKILIGFELTSQAAVTESDLHTIHRVGTDTAEYFYRNSLAWCRWWTRELPADAGFHPWDSAAIAWIRHPEYFHHQQRGLSVRELDKENHWLKCDQEYPGGTATYCTGFADGASATFVRDLVAAVY